MGDETIRQAVLRSSIRKAVLNGGMTHREAAAFFKVSLRQVQKAVNPLKRTMQDRSYYARNRERYKSWAAKAYLRRRQRALEVASSPSSGS